MLERRGFLRGLVSLPLVGGGVTLIGKASVPVPLVDIAAAPILGDPRERARYAWEAFSSAMREMTAGSQGWHVQGGERIEHGSLPAHQWVRPQSVYYVTGAEPRCPSLVVDYLEDLAPFT